MNVTNFPLPAECSIECKKATKGVGEISVPPKLKTNGELCVTVIGEFLHLFFVLMN